MPEAEIDKSSKITWTAPEFIHYPKSKWWFAVTALVGIGLATYFFIQKEFLTGALFLLLLAIVAYFGRMPPRMIRIELTPHGIKINESLLPYQQIKSFWMVYQPPVVKTLNFETTAYLNPNYTLQLMDEDPVKIRKFLLEYLPEDLDRGEAISDKLTRTLKF